MDEQDKTDTQIHVPPRLVAGRNGGTLTPFTSETARLARRAREEKRMRLYSEGAQLAVERTDLIERYGSDAHMVERAINLQIVASTPEAGKAAVMADTALQRAQGYDTAGRDDSTERTVTNNVIALDTDAAARILDALARIASLPRPE